MADNYRQFSESYAISPAEAAWIRTALEEAEAYMTRLEASYGTGKKRPAVPKHATAPAFLRALLDDQPNGIGFQWSIEVDGNGRGLWIYDEQSGDVELAAEFLQEFLATFPDRTERVLVLIWADTCSRPRVSEFGGGAVVITKNRVEFMNAWSWAHARVEQIERETAHERAARLAQDH